MAGYRNTETDSSDCDSLKDEDFIPPDIPPIPEPDPASDSPSIEDFIPPIPPPPRSLSNPWPITGASDATWRTMSSMFFYMRPTPWYVTPYLPMGLAPPGQPRYRYLTPESEEQGMYVYSQFPPIEYPSTTVTTWLSNSPCVTPTINALGSIPAPYLSGYEGTVMNSGREQITRPAIDTDLQPRRERGRWSGRGRGITRRVTMFFGPVSRPWTRYSCGLYSAISNLSLNALSFQTEAELDSQEEKEEMGTLCITAPEEKDESEESSISGDSTPEPLGLAESTLIKNTVSDVTTDTILNEALSYNPEANVMQPTTESPLTLEEGPINLDPASEPSKYDSSDPQPGISTTITLHETTTETTGDVQMKSKIKSSSSSSLKQSNNGKKGSKRITQNPGTSSEAECEPISRSSIPLKLYDFLSPKLSEALVGDVSEIKSEEPASLENVNSPPTLEMDSAVQWPRLGPVKSRPIPQSEIHMHLQWPSIGHVRRAARSAIALQGLQDEVPLVDDENQALDEEMAAVQALMPPDLDNLAFLSLFAAEVWPELPPGDPELMDLISRILRETWLLLDPEDQQSLAQLAALSAWPQRRETEKPD